MKKTHQSYKRLEQLIGKKTYREIAEQLNQEGYPTARGGTWTAANVATKIFVTRNLTRKANSAKPAKGVKVVTIKAKQLSANKKLSMIKQIVLGLHAS